MSDEGLPPAPADADAGTRTGADARTGTPRLALPLLLGTCLAVCGGWIWVAALWGSAGCDMQMSHGVDGVARRSDGEVAVWRWGVETFSPLWMPIVAPLLGWAAAAAARRQGVARPVAWTALALVVMWDLFLLGGGCVG